MKNPTFDNRFWKIFIPFLFLFIFIMFLPALLTKKGWFGLDFTVTGPIGDTIGGTTGPFIAIAAAILTFLAFWVQFIANEQQRKDLKIERFENKYYELLQLHKSNVNEMSIGEHINGRKCFVHMFYELRCLYQIIEEFNESLSKTDDIYKGEDINLLDLTYRIFFFGIGLNSEKHFLHILKKNEKYLFNNVKPFLEKIQNDTSIYLELNPSKRYYTYGLPTTGIPNEKTVEFYYFPFDGHVNKLGHYYRHLFQTLCYITDQNILDDNEKYGYIKTLRAQISNFEQLNIYYNALAWFDDEWRMFFTKYRFIKNLPISLADFYKNPVDHFKIEIEELKSKGIAMFEWME